MGLKVELNSISIATLVPAALIFYGTGFQLGYFAEVGIEFLPMLGVIDFIYPIGALVGIGFIWIPLSMFIVKRVHPLVANDALFETRLGKVISFWTRYVYVIFVLVILFSMYYNSRSISLIYNLVGLLILFICALIFYINLRLQHESGIEYSHSTALWFCLSSALLAYNCGVVYAETFAGRQCWFRTHESHLWQGLYLRSLTDGHLARVGKQTVFISKDSLKESCAAEKHPSPLHYLSLKTIT
jgi:hypothetical protein